MGRAVTIREAVLERRGPELRHRALVLRQLRRFLVLATRRHSVDASAPRAECPAEPKIRDRNLAADRR